MSQTQCTGYSEVSLFETQVLVTKAYSRLSVHSNSWQWELFLDLYMAWSWWFTVWVMWAGHRFWRNHMASLKLWANMYHI